MHIGRSGRVEVSGTRGEEVRLTVQQILNVAPVLRKLATQDLDAPVAFRVGRLARKMEPDIKAAEESRVKLIQEHGEQSGDTIQVKPENFEAFVEALKPLLETEVTIAGLDPLPLAALGSAKLTASEMLLLEDLNLLLP